MNYPPRNRARSSYYKPLLFLAILFIVGAVFFYFLGGVLVTAVSPLWKAENRFSSALRSGIELLHTRQTLVAENESLKERLASLELQLSSRSSVPEQESAILNILGRHAADGGIAATALIRPPQTPYDVLLIDAGSRDGIKAEAPVSLPEGARLGIVTEVFPNTSKVRLFSAPGEKTSAILERGGLAVTLEGTGGGNFKIVVPRETPVEVGDRVLSADIGASLMAVVGAIKLEPTDSFKEVLAKSPANIFSIRILTIRP